MKPCPAHSHIFMPPEQERKTGKVSQNNGANTVAKYTRLVNAPHTGRNAKKCSGMNHFANVCQGGGFRKSSKPVHTLRSEADTEGTGDDGQLFVGTLFIGDIQANDWQTKLRVNDTPVTFKLDTGAQANVLPVNVYRRIQPNKPLPRTRTVLTAFGDAKITPVGETQLRVTCPVTGRSQLMNSSSLILRTLLYLGRMHANPRTSCRAFALTVISGQQATETFSLVLAENEYHIELDPSVPPVIQTPRKVPHAKHTQLKETLDKLERDGIIASVDEPTDWVHNLVITEKRNGSLRICLDPRPLNKAIKRERCEIPTPADVQSQLGDKQIFTAIYMKDGYWHVKLTEESSHLCTFHTPWGRKRFTRMPFGISSASDVMQ